MITIYENDFFKILIEEETTEEITEIINLLEYVYDSKREIFEFLDFMETLRDVIYYVYQTEDYPDIISEELEILEDNYYIEFK